MKPVHTPLGRLRFELQKGPVCLLVRFTCDPMDRKAQVYLKKAWEACSANFKLALATTCVACTLDLWLKQLHTLLESDTLREEILDALPT